MSYNDSHQELVYLFLDEWFFNVNT